MGGGNETTGGTRLGAYRARAFPTHAARPAIRRFGRGNVFKVKRTGADFPDGTFQFRVANGRLERRSTPHTGMPALRHTMKASEFSKLAGRLMRHAAAPFHEHAVRGEVEKI